MGLCDMGPIWVDSDGWGSFSIFPPEFLSEWFSWGQKIEEFKKKVEKMK